MDARALEYKIAPDVAVEPVTANGVRAGNGPRPQMTKRDAAVLWLHGGGYVIGSLDSHRHLVSEAGRATRRSDGTEGSNPPISRGIADSASAAALSP
jgi:acetyl esterase/lipase